MFSSVELVRSICKEQGITVCQLEKDCGFSNGYLNPKKLSKLPYDRALKIAEYLDVSVERILTGRDRVPRPPRQPDILDRIDVAFYGEYKTLTKDDQALIRDMVHVMRQRRMQATAEE